MRTCLPRYALGLTLLQIAAACGGSSKAETNPEAPAGDAGGVGSSSEPAQTNEGELEPPEEPYVVSTSTECETDPGIVCQFGTEESDYANVGAVDLAGNVWIAGATYGNISGTNLGGTDAFLRSYAADGSPVVTVQFGDVGQDEALALLPDEAGNVWIAGSTQDPAGSGKADAFLRKYDTSGNLLDSVSFGTAGDERITAITADPDGGLWVVGVTTGEFETGEETFGEDGFLRKVNEDSSLGPAIQFGSEDNDSVGGVAIDRDHAVWVVGCGGDIFQAEGEGTMFARRYPADGSDPTTVLFAGGAEYVTQTYDDCAYAAKADSEGNIWVATEAYFADNYSMDALVLRFLPDGTQDEGYRFDTDQDDRARDIAFDSEGNLWVTGYTRGAFPGTENEGYDDVFVFKVPADGGDSQFVQFGTEEVDYGESIGVDSAGHAWVLGETSGNFDASENYNRDAFLRRVEF